MTVSCKFSFVCPGLGLDVLNCVYADFCYRQASSYPFTPPPQSTQQHKTTPPTHNTPHCCSRLVSGPVPTCIIYPASPLPFPLICILATSLESLSIMLNSVCGEFCLERFNCSVLQSLVKNSIQCNFALHEQTNQEQHKPTFHFFFLKFHFIPRVKNKTIRHQHKHSQHPD